MSSLRGWCRKGSVEREVTRKPGAALSSAEESWKDMGEHLFWDTNNARSVRTGATQFRESLEGERAREDHRLPLSKPPLKIQSCAV